MEFKLWYHEEVVKKDISALSSDWKKQIKNTIEVKLLIHPEVFGKPLRCSLKGYRKLRVGDYRIVFRIEKEKIKIFAILHRSIVYKAVPKRVV